MSETDHPTLPQRGRPRADEPPTDRATESVTAAVTLATRARIDAALAPFEPISNFLRAAIELELARREAEQA